MGSPDKPLDGARPRGLDALFRPRSVAVIGTAAARRTIGREVLANLLRDEFCGVVYPVNPRHAVVQSQKCWPSVEAIPDPVDLAVVVVPAAAVPQVARECARAGVGAMIVISAGFRETGPPGTALEQELADVARGAGMRLVGPNCMGVINTDPEVRLNASFAAAVPRPGNLAFVSQSGALGEAILAAAQDLGLGIAYFVSIGNRADVSINELLEHWEDDPRVGPILLYLESFGDPRRFPDIARRVSRKKPILAVKAGRTVAGASAARSHTGALAGQAIASDTLLAQCGVLRVDSMEELFGAAPLFAHQPLPRGRRLGIVSNAGGPGILATDAAVALGLELAELGAPTRAALARVLPPEASLGNPVDMVASAGPEQFGAATAAVLADPGVDALMVLFVTPVYVDSVEVARALTAAVALADKPVTCCFMGKQRHAEAVAMLRDAGLPVHAFPEGAARALALAVRHREWLDRPRGEVPDLVVDGAAGAAIVAAALAAGRDQLGFDEARRLLLAYGFPFAPTLRACSLDEVAEAADHLGFPLVLKATAAGLSHKSDRGGVAVDLRSMDEVTAAWRRMRQALQASHADLSFLVQRKVAGDREVILGMRQDADFGPLLMFGLGGIVVEVLRDVSFRVHPITDVDAREMIRSLRGHALLAGVRGMAPVPEGVLVDLLLRLDRMVADLEALEELDINPVIVGGRPEETAAVDVRVALRPMRS